MLSDANDPINTDVDARAVAFTAARGLLSADQDADEVMRVAEWLLTGSALLNPVKLGAAAKVLVDVSGGAHGYDNLSEQAQASYEGRAARVIIAYLTAGDV